MGQLQFVQERPIQPVEGVTCRIDGKTKEPAGRVRSFLKRLKREPGFPILLDLNGEVSKAWKAYADPSTFLIDRTGTIRDAKSGALEWDDQEVIDTIASFFEGCVGGRRLSYHFTDLVVGILRSLLSPPELPYSLMWGGVCFLISCRTFPPSRRHRSRSPTIDGLSGLNYLKKTRTEIEIPLP